MLASQHANRAREGCDDLVLCAIVCDLVKRLAQLRQIASRLAIASFAAGVSDNAVKVGIRLAGKGISGHQATGARANAASTISSNERSEMLPAKAWSMRLFMNFANSSQA